MPKRTSLNTEVVYQMEKAPIDLCWIFPEALAAALLSKAQSDRVDPVRILQTLLPVIGTVLGSRIRIELKKGDSVEDSHIEYPIFFTADICHPSTGSGTRGILLKPLQEMHNAEHERMKEAFIQLEQLKEAWKTMGKQEKAKKFDSDENPRNYEAKYCKPKKWLFDEATAQALTKRISEQEPKQGGLLVENQLAGLFDSLDQFSSGKGGKGQFLLKAWNKPLRGSVDRVDSKNASYSFKNQTLSLTGKIQPAVAKRIFNVAGDPDGMLSRFLPAIASIPDNFAEWSTVRVNLYGPLKNLIEGLQRRPETLLVLPPRSSDIFWNHREDLRRGQDSNFDSNPAYSYFLQKQISYTARFAVVIHCLENMDATTLPTEVSAETMNKAIRLSHFYCSQFLLLQSKSGRC